MTTISREAAKLEFARKQLGDLSSEERESRIMEWWPLEPSDDGWAHMSAELQSEMLEFEEFSGRADDVRYQPVLELSLLYKLHGVTNEWLQATLTSIRGREVRVGGLEEPMACCPCCHRRSIRERGEYEICQVCFWEDDGSDEPERHSGPNHMTLAEGRANVERVGVSDERCASSPRREDPSRYHLDKGGSRTGGPV